VRTSKNPRALAANSQFVAQRIRRVWNRDASVVFPPVDTQRFTPGAAKSDFFLCASRLHYYKRFDVIVKAFASLPDSRLVVIGEGPELGRLQAMATPNVSFLGYQPDDALTDHLQRARALLFAAEEDFGILPVEAQACGTPVIALGKGGALETVRGLTHDSPTGVFFPEQEAAAVHAAVQEFLANEGRLAPAACRKNALRFSEQTFRSAFRQFVDGVLQRA
jgi:glycosyltransferase involved in cell wall biosynthesis